MNRMFYRNRKFLEERLAEEQEAGFDRVNAIGGMSLDGKHASIIFMYFYDYLLREKFLMVIPYKSDYFKTEVIFKSTKRETPVKTVIREVAEETGITLSKNDVKLFHTVYIYEKGVKGVTHTKYFFHYKRYLDLKMIPDNFYEGLGEVGSPFFIKSSLIKYYLFPGHYSAIRK